MCNSSVRVLNIKSIKILFNIDFSLVTHYFSCWPVGPYVFDVNKMMIYDEIWPHVKSHAYPSSLTLFSNVYRATIQSPQLNSASRGTPTSSATFSDSSQPVTGLRTSPWSFAELYTPTNSSHWKPGPCGRPVTCRAADHTPRERPAARQLGAG